MSYYRGRDRIETELIYGGTVKCVYDIAAFDVIRHDPPFQYNWLSASRFSTGPNSTIFWNLDLAFFPRDDVSNDSDHMLLSISVPSGGKADYRVYIGCPVKYMNSEGEEIELPRTKTKVDADKRDFVCQYTFSRYGIMRDPKAFWPLGTLRLLCYVHVEISMPIIDMIRVRRPANMHFFSHLVDSEEYSDVTLCVGEKEYRAHKLFLSARSPVFAAMFNSDMREKNEGRVVLKGIDCKIAEAMLRYIYTNEIPPDIIIPEVLIAADVYGILCLKQLCEQKLSAHVTRDNSYGYLLFADIHNCRLLSQYVMNFLLALDPPRSKRVMPGRIGCRKNK